MKQRLIVAGVGVPLLLVVLLVLPAWGTALLVCAIAGVGAFELMRAVGKNARRLLYMTIAAAVVLPLGLHLFGLPAALCFAVLFIYALFAVSVCCYGKDSIPFSDLTAAMVAGVVFPLLLSCIFLLRSDPDYGKIYVLTPFFTAFIGDSFAMFGGMLFGKHKLAPYVSPKKTVEGGVAGLVGGALGMVLWGVIVNCFMPCPVSYPSLIAYGIVGSAVGQLGDLSLSVIKREAGIKDYGNLLPGHGGAYDRFDSSMFIAPVYYLLLVLK
ncbi:MAG: phosphatidate cytidylyltransferase [Oscillospiraceae bacterium]